MFDQPDAQSVEAQYDRIIDALADKLSKVADHLESARADLLAFTDRNALIHLVGAVLAENTTNGPNRSATSASTSSAIPS